MTWVAQPPWRDAARDCYAFDVARGTEDDAELRRFELTLRTIGDSLKRVGPRPRRTIAQMEEVIAAGLIEGRSPPSPCLLQLWRAKRRNTLRALLAYYYADAVKGSPGEIKIPEEVLDVVLAAVGPE